jgi:transposase
MPRATLRVLRAAHDLDMAAQPRPPASIPHALKRQGPRVGLPGVNEAALRAALAAETRPRIRRRLLAIQALRSGASRREAATIAGAGFGSVKNWLRILQRSGWKTLMQTPTRRKPFGAAAKTRAFKEIEAALARRVDARSRRRILVVRDVLSGQDIYAVSRRVGVNRTTVTQWLARARRFGVADLIRQPKRKTLSAKLRASPRIAASPGRPTGLTTAQLWELSELLQERPAMSWSDLLVAVKQRFGVTYTERGISRLVQKELGYRRAGRRFVCQTRRSLRRYLSRNG